jgi:hypothetical protein
MVSNLSPSSLLARNFAKSILCRAEAEIMNSFDLASHGNPFVFSPSRGSLATAGTPYTTLCTVIDARNIQMRLRDGVCGHSSLHLNMFVIPLA